MTDPFTDAPIAPQGDIPPKNGIGTTGLVLGIIALTSLWIPILNLFSWFIGLVAMVFGAIGLNRARPGLATNRGTAAGGFFSGLSAVVVAILFVVIVSDGEVFAMF